MAKLTRVRQPLPCLATAVEGSLYLLCIPFSYKAYGETGSRLVYVVGVLPLCQQRAVGEGGMASRWQQHSWGDEAAVARGAGGAQQPPRGGLSGEEKGQLAAGSGCIGR